MDKKKIIIRIGKQSLSFAAIGGSSEDSIRFEPYVVKVGASMAANLREAFKTESLIDGDIREAQVLLDTPAMLVPLEQFGEEEMAQQMDYVFPAGMEKREVLYNVLPSQNAVCIFAANKDLHNVIGDRFEKAQFIQAATPVWQYLHQRSFTGHRNKLYGYFHDKQADILCFQQNRFKFCNTFDTTSGYDALYFLLYVWKQLHMAPERDEIHLVGDIPQQEWLVAELKAYMERAYVINPTADFQQAPATKVAGMPYDLMTFLTKGR